MNRTTPEWVEETLAWALVLLMLSAVAALLVSEVWR